jgi:hypothetical protein
MSSKSDGAGFQTKRIKAKLNAPPHGPWMPIGREMLRSGAMRALSIHARRAFDRIMIEHMDHAGQENGRLKVTWRDFEKFGIHRRDIKPALRELIAVGFISIESPGRAIIWGQSKGDATQYRLTFLPVSEPNDFRAATNEWKHFEENVSAAKTAIEKALGQEKPSRLNGDARRNAQPPKFFPPVPPLVPETGPPAGT